MPSSIVPHEPGLPPAPHAACASCSAPLAGDQLFCLSCGARRRDARIAFRDVLASEAAPVVAAAPPAWGAGPTPLVAPQQASATSPAILLGAAVSLMLALGLGVWIGRGQDPPAAVASPAVAVPVAAAATTPTETTPTDDASTSDGAAASDDASADDAKGSGDAETGAADAKAPEPPAAAKNLEKLSTEDYQKQSQKLPSQVGTGGEAPPKDDKTGGGGTEFEDFQ